MPAEQLPPSPQPDNVPTGTPVPPEAATPPPSDAVGSEAITTADEVPAWAPTRPSPRARDCRAPNLPVEIIAPTQVFLRTEGGEQPARRTAVMAAFTPDAIWIQDTWKSQTIQLRTLAIESRRDGQELVLTVGPETSAERVTLAFGSAAEGERWYREILEHQ